MSFAQILGEEGKRKSPIRELKLTSTPSKSRYSSIGRTNTLQSKCRMKSRNEEDDFLKRSRQIISIYFQSNSLKRCQNKCEEQVTAFVIIQNQQIYLCQKCACNAQNQKFAVTPLAQLSAQKSKAISKAQREIKEEADRQIELLQNQFRQRQVQLLRWRSQQKKIIQLKFYNKSAKLKQRQVKYEKSAINPQSKGVHSPKKSLFFPLKSARTSLQNPLDWQ